MFIMDISVSEILTLSPVGPAGPFSPGLPASPCEEVH